jgi:HAE1 family hydrophobic/amphiphilic exporter-1
MSGAEGTEPPGTGRASEAVQAVGAATLRGSERLYGFFVRRPIALISLLVLLLVISAIAFTRLPLQLLPSGIAQARLSIFLPNPGATAQENEARVARVVEEQLRTLSGIERVRSFIEADLVRVRVDFDANLDMDLAKAEVRDRIERARPLLPETVEQIEMWSSDADQMPIIWFGILHGDDEDKSGWLVDRIVKPRLEAVSGVSRVEIFGVLDDSLRILLDEQRVEAAQLDLGALVQRLAKDNFAQPLGEIEDGGRRFLLRSDMRFEDEEQVANYPVTDKLRIRDLGEVVKVKSVRDQLTRIDGSYAYFAIAFKDSQSNVVEVSRALKQRIVELGDAPELKGQLSFLPFGSQGEIIEASLDQLKDAAISGGWLALLVLFIFLRRVRLTLCVAAGVPISALLALAWEYFTGGSFNVLTMAGITLGVGMLVDNAVVVVENISRLHALGRDGNRAAIEGTSEIALAVTLSTLTSVVVFLPLIFMTEQPILRIMFAALGIPLCSLQIFSLLVALVFLPVAAARLQGPRPRWLERTACALVPIALLPARLLHALAWLFSKLGHGLYVGALAAARVALAVLVPLRWALVLALWTAGGMWVFERAQDQLRAQSLGLPGPGWFASGLIVAGCLLATWLVAGCLPAWGRDLRAIGRAAAAPARAVLPVLDLLDVWNRRIATWALRHRFAACLLAALALASVYIPMTRMSVTGFGQDSNNDYLEFDVEYAAEFDLEESSQQMGHYEDWLIEHKSELTFDHYACNFSREGGELEIFWDVRQSPSQIDELRVRLQRELPRLPGHKIRFWNEDQSADRSRSLTSFTLRGPESTELERIGLRAIRLLEGVPGLEGVSSPLQAAPDQLRVVFDREKAHGLDVDPQAAQQTISWVLRGFQLPRYHDRDREIPFLIEYDSTATAGLETLRDLSVFNGSSRVALSAFANVEIARGTRAIYREDGQTTFSIQARVSDPARMREAQAAGLRALESLELPRGYSIDTSEGALQRQQDEFKELSYALVLSIALVFLLMVILFESPLPQERRERAGLVELAVILAEAVVPASSVLLTIPFAILGSLWLLFVTGTAMDSIGYIGLIILAGIVVNNGIVLVDCFHRLRLEGMPRMEAVIEGCGRRLRPILMTALTTVIGLVPMATQEPATNSLDYRALATCVAGGLACSTLFALWIVPVGYTLLDDAVEWLGDWLRVWTRPFARKSAAAKVALRPALPYAEPRT